MLNMKTEELQSYQHCLAHLAFVPTAESCRRRFPDDSIMSCLIDPFRFDKEMVLGSRALTRLSGKTQVFPAPKKPHTRTRRRHTDEVVSYSAMAAELLGGNVALTEAIGLGHDLGHPPFGHLGERMISDVTGYRFDHAVFSVIIAQKIGRSGRGYNLTHPVLSGYRDHSSSGPEIVIDDCQPLETGVVKVIDPVSFTLGDLRDTVREGIYTERELPSCLWELGADRFQQTMNCVAALVKESAEAGKLSFSHCREAVIIRELMEWSPEHIYRRINDDVMSTTFGKVFEFFKTAPMFEGYDPAIMMAMLTDREVIEVYGELVLKRWLTMDDLKDLGAWEVIQEVGKRQIDFTDPDLDW